MDNLHTKFYSTSIGERVRQQRQKRGFSQAELSQNIFLPSYIAAIEAGQTQPSLNVLEILAQRMNMNLSELLGTSELDQQAQEARLRLMRGQVLLAGVEPKPRQAFEQLLLINIEYLDENEVSEVYYLQGLALLQIGNESEALAKLELARSRWAQIGETIKSWQAGIALVEIYMRRNKLPPAQTLLIDYVEAIRNGEICPPALKLSIYANLARIYSAAGKHSRARELHSEVRDLANQIQTAAGLSAAYLQMAESYLRKGELTKAYQTFEQAYLINHQSYVEWLTQQHKLNFGRIYAEAGDFEQAQSLYQEVLLQQQQRIHNDIEVAGYIEQAKTYLSQNNLDHAKEAVQAAYEAIKINWDSLEVLTRENFPLNRAAIGQATLILAQIHEQEKQYKQADDFFQDAIHSLQINGTKEALGKAYFLYAKALLDRGDTFQGSYYMQLACEMNAQNQ